MQPITTIIFDVYETLVHNYVGLWKDAFKYICNLQDLRMDPNLLWTRWKAIEVEFRNRRVNLSDPDQSPPFKSYREIWQECFSKAFIDLGLMGDAYSAAEILRTEMGRRNPYPDVWPSLKHLGSDYRLAALSNADDDFLEVLLSNHSFPFEVVLSSESAQVYKPHPKAFLQIVAQLGISMEEGLFVGDSLFDDIQGARMVGMRVVWINRTGVLQEEPLPYPDYEIIDLTQLHGVLQSLQGV